MAFQRRKSAAFGVRAHVLGFVEPALASPLKGKSDKIVMVAFDLLYLDGYDLRKMPQVERKAQLKRLIGKTAIQFSDSFEIDGPAMFKHACRIGVEPSLLAEIEYRAKSAEGKLRHPFFKGIREDM
jgi:bifunctional non-homologous end joining protein LigD